MNQERVNLSRRNLAKTAIMGMAATTLFSAPGRAADANPNENIIFTAADPAHWAGKEATHVPVVTVEGGTLNVKTPHPMTDAHFIVSHSVVLEAANISIARFSRPRTSRSPSTSCRSATRAR